MPRKLKIILGIVSLLIGGGILINAYSSLPSASTCAAINQAQRQLGQAATCHSSPSTSSLIAAAVFGVVGLVLLVSAPSSGG